MRRSGIVLFSAVIACQGLFCGCFTRRSMTVEDSSGVKVALKAPACRIVSTVPSNTEILYALGLKDRVVGVTKYCAKTCDTKGKVVIGGWTNPDFGQIRALKPDLIFAFGGMQRRHQDEFRNIAPTFCFEPTTVEATFQAVRDIGRLTQRDPKAKAIVTEQRQRLAYVQARLASLSPGDGLRVARVFGTDTNVMTVGKQSFLTDVIRLAGGVNVFCDVDDDYFQVPFERLASLDPDVLIVHGEQAEAEKKKAAFAESPEFSTLKAVKNGRVLVYSCDHICHPNAALAETVEMVARGLHPDVFNQGKIDH